MDVLAPRNRHNTFITIVPSPPLTPSVSTASDEEIYQREVAILFEDYENQLKRVV
jgi:hypothetical protein